MSQPSTQSLRELCANWKHDAALLRAKLSDFTGRLCGSIEVAAKGLELCADAVEALLPTLDAALEDQECEWCDGLPIMCAACIQKMQARHDAAICEGQKEVANGFDAIFGYVPEARDERGNSLTLAQKIVRLGEMYLAAAYPPKGRSQNGQAE